MKMIPQSKIKLPVRQLRRHALLLAALAGSGTIYQLCERADIDINTTAQENTVRQMLDLLILSGAVSVDGILYSITDRARAALAPVAAPKVTGHVATPHYRGPSCAMPVTIIRKSTREARAV